MWRGHQKNLENRKSEKKQARKPADNSSSSSHGAR